MRAYLSSRYGRLSLVAAGMAAWALGVVGLAGATADPTLTTATGQVQTYFTSNIGIVVGLFVGVAALLWLLKMAFNSVGVRRSRSI